MLLDTIHGTIDRRVLLNYRLDPDVLERVLPRPFRPKLFAGVGIGGVCMIRNWSVTALAVDEAQSAFFEDANRFPAGSATLDGALLVRGIEHEWHSRPDLYVAPNGDGFTTRRVTP